MKRAVVLGVLLLASPSYAWQPPSGGPSKMAKHVLDSLPEPSKVAIPHDIEQRSRNGATVPLPVPVDSGVVGVHGYQPPGGCWQVQITAVSDADRAKALAAEESSRLGVTVYVAVEGGLSKLRARGQCLTYEEAGTLRDRIRDSGYPGAFLIRSSETGS